jgi:hypothetical protein
MTPALKNAIQVIMKEIGQFEGREMGRMRGGGGDKVVEVEVEPAATHAAEQHACPECATGECTNPDHASDEEYDQMMA